ncbi:DEAD/DEAH box helicase [Wolbachia endosymbiont of Howardula sp.]|uniref:DEAD/DEAH box helicase n=1 Tax=Wolbachia endosymbiont of Howardula sp. TaxID=2916816 RepID=UPI00217F17C6|nr:DEAD/DEAH box helicase [Wolbachia endosymbiont of Howardula sp.]UWI83032.1 DEAD/DEAH box helicase [Wolbachia endosymbiont of Howardula sp.]
MNSFLDMNLHVSLMQALDRNKLSIPTPIQARVIPLAIQGRDILGSAQTGTGKTLAFALPIITKLLEQPNAFTAMIIVPTRELAHQVTNEIQKLLSQDSILKIALLIGGDPIFKQLNQLRKKPQIIIGTPGRIIDHLYRNTLSTRNIGILVLDETDRMFDMGFGVQIEKIVQYVPKLRQTLMFSATLPTNIVQLAEKFLNQPERISIDSQSQVSTRIKEEVIYALESEKYKKLIIELLHREGSIIIFVRTKQGAHDLAYKLNKDSYRVSELHGDLRQHKRESAINAFRRGSIQIMVATDIAARGLDIPHIQHVMNYDIPQSQIDYIHRIGRTARAGSEGHAVSFVTPQDKIRCPEFLDKTTGKLNFQCHLRGNKKFNYNKKVFRDKKQYITKNKFHAKKLNLKKTHLL